VTDGELEDLLRRFRPIGAPPSLRDRVIVSRIVAWLPAAASVLLAALFYFLASTEHVWIDARLPNVPPIASTTEEVPQP
jgi:hypothetical protein